MISSRSRTSKGPIHPKDHICIRAKIFDMKVMIKLTYLAVHLFIQQIFTEPHYSRYKTMFLPCGACTGKEKRNTNKGVAYTIINIRLL